MKKIVSIGFVILLSIPMIVLLVTERNLPVDSREIFDESIDRSDESGVAELFSPEMKVAKIRWLDTVLSEKFGLRDEMIFLNAWRDVKLLKSSPNEKVVVGRDGWLFLTESFVAPRFSDEEVEVIVDRLAGLDDVLFVGVPDKKNIYREYLPSWLQINWNDNYAKVMAELERRGVAHADALEILGDEEENMYSPIETHWNRYGVYLVFEEMMGALGIEVAEVVDIGEYERAADLSRMVGLNEVEQALLPILDAEFVPEPRGRLVFYYDSFGEGLIPFLEPYFEEIDAREVRAQSPFVGVNDGDFLIVEIVERDFKLLLQD